MEVEDAIKDLEAKADVLRATNPRAMEQYEARLAEVCHNRVSSRSRKINCVIACIDQKIDRKDGG